MKSRPPLPIRVVRRPIALAVALVALFDFFFYRQSFGFAAGIYVALTTAAILLLRPALRAPRRFAFLLLAQAGLVFSMIEQPGVIDLMLALAGFVALPIIAGIGIPPNFRDWMTAGGKFWAEIPRRTWRDGILTTRRLARCAPFLLRIKYWVIPVILSLVFVKLFAIANPIIQEWISRLEPWAADLWKSLSAWLSPWRLLMWFLVGALVWSYLRHRPRSPKSAEPAKWLPPVWSSLVNHPAGQKIILNCLILFNVVFAAQTTLDIIYLFGGAALPKGMTYAEYAHRGAYPLIFTALLAAAFVLLTFSHGAASASNRAMKNLVFLWLAQNVFLTYSSIWRLDIYVDVYSLTRLRFAAGIWMALVALGLILIGVRIVRSHTNQWLFNANVIAVAATFYLCGIINFDGIIAGFNLKHCKDFGGRGVALDTGYLEDLGFEALPAMLEFCKLKSQGDAAWDQRTAKIFQASRMLTDELETMNANWRGWTWRRDRLRRRVAEYASLDEKFRALELRAASHVPAEKNTQGELDVEPAIEKAPTSDDEHAQSVDTPTTATKIMDSIP